MTVEEAYQQGYERGWKTGKDDARLTFNDTEREQVEAENKRLLRELESRDQRIRDLTSAAQVVVDYSDSQGDLHEIPADALDRLASLLEKGTDQ